MRFLYDNYVDTATLSSGGAIPGFGLANLQDSRLSRRYRAISTNDAIVIDLGSARHVDSFALAQHNISTQEVQLQANSANDWASPPFDETISINSRMGYAMFTAQTYRYWRVVVDDPANLLGQIEIGRIALGVSFVGPAIGLDAQIPRRSTSARAFSRSRQTYVNEGKRYRAGSVNFGFITDAEKNKFAEMFEFTDRGPIFIDFQLPSEQALYAVVSGEFALSYNFTGRFFTMALEFEEVF